MRRKGKGKGKVDGKVLCIESGPKVFDFDRNAALGDEERVESALPNADVIPTPSSEQTIELELKLELELKNFRAPFKARTRFALL